MPELKTRLQVEEIFTQEEYEYLTWGFLPVSMDDRWFFYLEEDWLHIHRSWSGFCIFQVRLEQFEDGYKIAEAWVNDSPEQGYDRLLLFWIDFLIRQNKKRDYCCTKVILAFLICIFIKESLSKDSKFISLNYLVFIISFLSYIISNCKFDSWDFYEELYNFIDYY